ncbi:MAG: 6-phosphogluconolactonase [Planctomycetota bacterium]
MADTPSLQVHPDGATLAAAAADWLTAQATIAVAARGRFAIALSGGNTPWAMLEQWARCPVPWDGVHIFQVDERDAPAGDEQRNWTHIERVLLQPSGVPKANQHPMPVGHDDADQRYADTLAESCGDPPLLDVVQLGLGSDGHTASLVPGDPALDVDDREVAWTASEYAGTRRLTLTYPCLARARAVLWLVSGAAKAPMVQRLCAGDQSIPAGRVATNRAHLFLDHAAVPQ